MRFDLCSLRRLQVQSSRRRRTYFACPRLEVLEDRLTPSADFVQTNLVSDLPGLASTTDANLINPWGLVASPSGPWWVANEGSGTSTLYNGQGQPQPPNSPLIVSIPRNPGGSFLPHGSPTGIVFNTSGSGFNVTEGSQSGPSFFLFATLDGTISGWNPKVDPTHAIVEVTETGSSLRANRLRIIDTVMESETHLIANKKACTDPWKKQKLESLAMMLRGAIDAQGQVGLMLNVEKENLATILKVLPSLHSPTVSELSDPTWVAVNTILEESTVRDVIPKLKAAKATGIVEYPLNKVVL